MREYTDRALDTAAARGAQYVDVRVETRARHPNRRLDLDEPSIVEVVPHDTRRQRSSREAAPDEIARESSEFGFGCGRLSPRVLDDAPRSDVASANRCFDDDQIAGASLVRLIESHHDDAERVRDRDLARPNLDDAPPDAHGVCPVPNEKVARREHGGPGLVGWFRP